MPKVKVKLKKGVGKVLRLTDPGGSIIINTDGEVDLDEAQYKRVQKYVDKVKAKPVPKPKPVPEPTKSEDKIEEVSKE